jgi:DNA-binding response OmpR family regulator
MRVAILDDEPAELRRVEQTLQQMAEAGEQSWSLYSFERGEDLLRHLRRETFDLLILDWQLPDLTGLSLLLWTREQIEAPPAAIMLTSRDGKPIVMTEREYRLAHCLFSNLGRPLSRDYLYERLWPHEEMSSSRPLDTHIYRLRNKLGLRANRGWQLLTIYGYGCRLESVAPVAE